MNDHANAPTPPLGERYIAIDLHKHYLMIGGLDAHQRVVLHPRKLDLDRWPAWAQANLTATDAVVIEATTNAWHIYDQVVPLVGRVVVAHPPKVKQIAAARVKTDKHDVLVLAQLLRADLIPEVWVPPPHVRDLRALISHRQRLLRARTMGRNRLHSLLHRYNLTPPPGDLFAAKQRAWWTSLEVSVTERLRVDQDLATLDHLAGQIATLEAELQRLLEQIRADATAAEVHRSHDSPARCSGCGFREVCDESLA
jgi:transposase